MQLHGPARSVDLYALKKGIKHLEGAKGRRFGGVVRRGLKEWVQKRLGIGEVAFGDWEGC